MPVPNPHRTGGIPRAPRVLGGLARSLPLAPLTMVLTALAKQALRRHPSLTRRLGGHARSRFLLELTDMPLALLLEPAQARVRAYRHEDAPSHDARIAGTLAAFLGMVHGRLDGDALFFSRDLVIGGDTEAALALRNAIDDAELDLSLEAAQVAGVLAPLLRGGVRLAEAASGVALSRRPA